MDGFEEEVNPRPEFHGDLIRSPINGKLEKHFPSGKRRFRSAVALTTATIFVCIVITLVGIIFYYRG